MGLGLRGRGMEAVMSAMVVVVGAGREGGAEKPFGGLVDVRRFVLVGGLVKRPVVCAFRVVWSTSGGLCVSVVWSTSSG